jgi:hypothetical protein
VTFTAFYQHIPALSILVAVTFLFCGGNFGGCHLLRGQRDPAEFGQGQERPSAGLPWPANRLAEGLLRLFGEMTGVRVDDPNGTQTMSMFKIFEYRLQVRLRGLQRVIVMRPCRSAKEDPALISIR